MADAIQFNVDAALAKLGELVAKHGPDAVNLAAQVVRVNAVQTLITGATAAALTTLVARLIVRHLREVKAENGGHLDIFDTNPLITIGCSIGLLIIAPFAFGNLLDVWAWIALFSPKFALAHEVLAKLTAA